MAVNFDVEGVRTHDGGSSSRSLDIGQRLVDMGCPLLSGMEAATVLEVLLPSEGGGGGEARLRVLQWLVGRFHPILQDVLFSTGSIAMTDIPRLTGLLAGMGICRRTDYNLVQGTTGAAKQLNFLETLLDLVEVSNRNALDVSTSLSNQVEHSCSFTDALCRREDLSSVFPSTASLLPPDLAKSHPENEARRPSLVQLQEEMVGLQQHFEMKSRELNQVMQDHSYAGHLNPSAIDSACKSIAVSLSTLSQLTANFTHCYEADLRPWTNRQTQVSSSLGPQLRRVHAHTQLIGKLLSSLEQLEESLSHLKQLPSTRNHQTYLRQLCQEVQQAFQECRVVLGQTKMN